MDDGYIKFRCEWISAEPLPAEKLTEIKRWRDRLHGLGLIGSTDGVGFGNVSVKHGDGFIITGTATGDTEKIRDDQFTLVTAYDISKNSVNCEGPVKASSESLTHATLYERGAGAVIHVHSQDLWDRYINKLPTTSKDVEYGTPGMAGEVAKLMGKGKVLVMGGHNRGLISFGKTLVEAGNELTKII